MAAGILVTIVVATSGALTAGQQNAFEAHQRIAAALAAEDLIARITIESYDGIPTWHGFNEPVGGMLEVDGDPFPQSFDMIGREVMVTTSLRLLPDVGVQLRGRTIRVRAFNDTGRTLAELHRFVPEPPS